MPESMEGEKRRGEKREKEEEEESSDEDDMVGPSIQERKEAFCKAVL